MLREKGLSVDSARFDELMQEQKMRAKASWKGSGDEVKEDGDFKVLLEEFGKNEFIGYDRLECEAKILALLDENYKRVGELKDNQTGFVMLDKTPFYANSGGQIGDKGIIEGNEVLDTRKYFELNLSKIIAKNAIKSGEIVKCKVSSLRLQIRRHHSATHLLHYALREILGSHIAQAGSSVEADKLRFDFSHPKALSADELTKIENLVNDLIQAGAEAKTEILNIDEAKKSGAIALFGEKYGDKVRVLSLGPSKELCGGTHVSNLSEIGCFFITRESGVSAGIRRIEAVCAGAGVKYGLHYRAQINELVDELKNADLLNAVKKLKAELKTAKNEAKNASNAKSINASEHKGVKLVISEFDGDIKAKIDELKNQNEKIIAVLAKVNDNKINLAVGIKGVELKANEIVAKLAPIIGGGGGGRADFATAGGKDASKLDQMLNEANKLITNSL